MPTATPLPRDVTHKGKTFRINTDESIQAAVDVDLDDVIRTDLEGFLDLITERAFGTDCVGDIGYSVIEAAADNVLRVLVCANDAAHLLDELTETQEATCASA